MSAIGVDGWREGAAVELASDNDEMGEIMFGSCWTAMKEGLAAVEAKAERGERYVSVCRFVSVTEAEVFKKPRRSTRQRFEETVFDRRTGKIRKRRR